MKINQNLSSIQIEILDMETHLFSIIKNKLLNKKQTSDVVKIRVIGFYDGGVQTRDELNLMKGDTVEISVKKNGKK